MIFFPFFNGDNQLITHIKNNTITIKLTILQQFVQVASCK